MKKFIKSGVWVTVIIVALFSVYSGVQAQVVSTPVFCPAGYKCTLNLDGGITTPGIGGTLFVSLNQTPSNVTVYQGQSYDVAAYNVRAGASDMAIQNISLDFNVRLWLYARTITIKDDSGYIVGQSDNLSASNFTELIVGSQYRLNIPVSSYTVSAIHH